MKKLLIILAALGLAGCAPSTWHATDLRALDPVDSADPALDLTAAYSRAGLLELDLRADLLDLPDDPLDSQPDILFALDTGPGGSSAIARPGGAIHADLDWDVLITLTAGAEPRVEAAVDGGLLPAFARQERDLLLDSVTVGMIPAGLPASFRAQAFAVRPGESAPADRSAVFESAQGADARAAVIFAFTHVFEARSPAQALRRWDGAHTGPLGERHGLRYLLAAAQRNGLPLFLDDLETPAYLSALDYVGGRPRLQKLLDDGLLAFPALPAAGPTGRAHHDFELTNQPAGSGLLRDGGVTYIPLPVEDEAEQPGPGGPSLDTRRDLLEAALSGDPGRITVLGGEFPRSAWGNADIAGPSMAYIAARPWIEALDGPDVTAFPAGAGEAPSRPGDGAAGFAIYNSQGEIVGLDSTALASKLQEALRAAPKGHITDSAQAMFADLTAPESDASLGQLKAQYLGEVGGLLTAAGWAETGSAPSGCGADLTYDGIPDCVLASREFFALIPRDGARLLLLFQRGADGLHQIVGPGEQFMTGASDRTEWRLERGPAADSQQHPGAFVDPQAPWQIYSAASDSANELRLTAPDGSRVISFLLSQTGLTVTVQSGSPQPVQLVLAVDPWQRFSPGWGSRYKLERTAQGFRWGVAGGPSVRVQASGPMSVQSFIDSRDLLAVPEDPDGEYPPGHFLPFPLVVGTGEPAATFSIELQAAQ